MKWFTSDGLSDELTKETGSVMYLNRGGISGMCYFQDATI